MFFLKVINNNERATKTATKNKNPCKSIDYKGFCGLDEITIEHLIPILMFIDKLEKKP